MWTQVLSAWPRHWLQVTNVLLPNDPFPFPPCSYSPSPSSTLNPPMPIGAALHNVNMSAIRRLWSIYVTILSDSGLAYRSRRARCLAYSYRSSRPQLVQQKVRSVKPVLAAGWHKWSQDDEAIADRFSYAKPVICGCGLSSGDQHWDLMRTTGHGTTPKYPRSLLGFVTWNQSLLYGCCKGQAYQAKTSAWLTKLH